MVDDEIVMSTDSPSPSSEVYSDVSNNHNRSKKLLLSSNCSVRASVNGEASLSWPTNYAEKSIMDEDEAALFYLWAIDQEKPTQ